MRWNDHMSCAAGSAFELDGRSSSATTGRSHAWSSADVNSTARGRNRLVPFMQSLKPKGIRKAEYLTCGLEASNGTSSSRVPDCCLWLPDALEKTARQCIDTSQLWVETVRQQVRYDESRVCDAQHFRDIPFFNTDANRCPQLRSKPMRTAIIAARR